MRASDRSRPKSASVSKMPLETRVPGDGDAHRLGDLAEAQRPGLGDALEHGFHGRLGPLGKRGQSAQHFGEDRASVVVQEFLRVLGVVLDLVDEQRKLLGAPTRPSSLAPRGKPRRIRHPRVVRQPGLVIPGGPERVPRDGHKALRGGLLNVLVHPEEFFLVEARGGLLHALERSRGRGPSCVMNSRSSPGSTPAAPCN